MFNSTVNIPVVLEVSYGATKKIGKILTDNNFKNIAIYMGHGINNLFGKNIIEGIENEENINILSSEEYEDINVESLVKKAYSLSKKVECVIGIGGGKAVDSAKYIASLNKIPFISVPTSISNDGFSSSGSSILVEGKRASVKSSIAYAIVADMDILKNAPERFYYSGLGDIVSKISATYDWEREEELGVTKINHFAMMLSKKSVNSVVRLPFSYIRDELFIKEVIDSLIMSGAAMQIAGSSAPASGSEHLISHALDQILERPNLHGIQVGIATYIMSKVQNHRSDRVETFLTDTGFFNYVKEEVDMRKEDLIEAIKLAKKIKPNRRTYIHEDEYIEKAIQLVNESEILNKILK